MSRQADKATFASIQHSQATMLKLMQDDMIDMRKYAKNFKGKIMLDYDDLRTSWKDVEEAINEASETCALSNNRKFIEAMALLREEVFSDNPDHNYFYQLRNQVLKLFDHALGWAQSKAKKIFHAYQLSNIKFLAKSTQVLEEAQAIEFLEDDYGRSD